MGCNCKNESIVINEFIDGFVNGITEHARHLENEFYKNRIDLIDHVTFNGPATIIFFKDGTKTVLKCHDEDTYSIPTGFALALLKKILGGAAYHKLCEEWLDDIYAAEKERLEAIERTKAPKFETRSRLDVLEEELAELKKELGK